MALQNLQQLQAYDLGLAKALSLRLKSVGTDQRKNCRMTGNELKNKNVSSITGYHSHVYYDAASKPQAEQLREAIEAHFEVQMGRWRDDPVGPHPTGSYQVAYGPELIGEILPWLALNRNGLTIFTHTETGDHMADHRDHAIWLGEQQALKLSIFE